MRQNDIFLEVIQYPDYLLEFIHDENSPLISNHEYSELINNTQNRTNYISLLNNDEIFDFCKLHTSDHEKPLITLSSLNILKLEYPLYVSKQWSEETLIGNTPFMIYYEVTSREDIVLDIGPYSKRY